MELLFKLDEAFQFELNHFYYMQMHITNK